MICKYICIYNYQLCISHTQRNTTRCEKNLPIWLVPEFGKTIFLDSSRELTVSNSLEMEKVCGEGLQMVSERSKPARLEYV